MKTWRSVFYLVTIVVTMVSGKSGEEAAGEGYPYRLAQVNLDDPSGSGEVDRFRKIARQASSAGYNGLVVNGAWDALDIETVYVHKNLREMRRIAEKYELKIIPTVFNVGYNAFLLKHNRHLAEGLKVENAPYLVKSGKATLLKDNEFGLVNGGMEQFKDDNPTGFQSTAGEASVLRRDKEEKKAGKSSLRVEGFGEDEGKIEQTIRVKPYRQYRIRLWIKTEGLSRSKEFGDGRFGVDAYGGGQRRLTYYDPQIPETSDWRKVEVAFNSKNYDEVELRIGVNGESHGKFWLDNLEVEEIGLVNVLRRPGTPLEVRSADSGMTYLEGVDFEHVEDPLFNFLFDHDGPAIELKPGSRIQEGERLEVDYYHAAVIYQGQTPVCVSEPEVYEIWKSLAPVLQDTLETDYYFLNTDEVRIAGTCHACRERGITVGEMIGETLRRQMKIIRKVNSEAVFFTWSDMFDPYHNANHDEGEDWYYLTDQSFEGAWEYLPKDLIIVNWNNRNKKKSTKFFEKLGYPVIAAGYYDKDHVERDTEWAEVFSEHGNAAGYLYSTWLDKYELLEEYSDVFE